MPLSSRGVLQGLVYLLFLPDPFSPLPFVFSWPYNLGLGTVFSTLFTLLLGERSYYYYHYYWCCYYYDYYFEGKAKHLVTEGVCSGF